jgi:hypothetical protein
VGRRAGALPFPESFWAKVDQSGGPDACWPFCGARNQLEHVTASGVTFKGGHGRFRVADQVMVASRVAYELEKGPIPPGEKVLHSCDNPPCCNPGHLTTGTQAQNIAEMWARGRRARKAA